MQIIAQEAPLFGAQTFADKVLALWSTKKGPFQNVFRLSSFILALLPGYKIAYMMAEKLASVLFGLGIEDFGAFIDKELGLRPYGNISGNEVDKLIDLILMSVHKKSATNSNMSLSPTRK